MVRCLFAALLCLPCFAAYNVRDFGARGDGRTTLRTFRGQIVDYVDPPDLPGPEHAHHTNGHTNG